MRTIVKRPQPDALTRWRQVRLAANKSAGMDCSYAELRRDTAVITAVEDALFAEQGGICAYTGHRLWLSDEGEDCRRRVGFHCEHLKSQERCRDLDGAVYGEDADYRNLVACWPPANCRYELPYGARAKGAWPRAADGQLFVSPLTTGCSERFRFSRFGRISPASGNDTAALETIKRLCLDNEALTALRRAEIQGKLRGIRRAEAKRLLQQLRAEDARLDAGQNIQLSPFCFAVEQALEREVHKLEGIRDMMRDRSRSDKG